MKVTTERPQEGVRALLIELPPERLSRELDVAWKRLSRSVNIPGFRPGKAPRAIVQRHVGAATIEREALRILLPTAYEDAVTEAAIDPIDQPDFDVVEMDRGKPFVFRATVPVRPEVQLGAYRDMRVPFQPPEVDPDQVERVLSRLQEGQAQWEQALDSTAQLGDQVVADIHVEWPDGRETDDKGLRIILGGNSYAEGFDEQVAGMAVGEDRDFTTTATEEQPGGTGAERMTRYRVRIQEVWSRQLPSLDDEFARSVSEHDSLEALRATVQEAVARETERTALLEHESGVLAAVVEDTTFEIPIRLVEAETQRLAAERSAAFRQQGLTVERYLELTNRTTEQWQTEVEEAATQQLHGRLVLDEVAEEEQLDPTPQEINAAVKAEIEQAAAADERSGRRVRSLLGGRDGQARVRASLRRQHALNWLVRNAGGDEPSASDEESSKEEETSAERPVDAAAEPEAVQSSAAADSKSASNADGDSA